MQPYTLLEAASPESNLVKVMSRRGLAGFVLAVLVLVPLHRAFWLHTPPQVLAADTDTVGGPGSPPAKRVVVGMVSNIIAHAAWDDWPAWRDEMEPFWTQDMVYDFNYVGSWGFGPTRGLREWYDGEHMHYNAALPDCQFTAFICAAANQTATFASYGLARWRAPFAGVPPPSSHPWVHIRDLDFYLLEGDRIKINWCIIDVVDLFSQVGYAVLPPAPMTTEGYLPPKAADGIPAPLSAMVDPSDTAQSELIWRAAIAEDYLDPSGLASHWANEITWYGPGGVGTAKSRHEYRAHFLAPLHGAFSNVSLQIDVLVCEGAYCGAHFYFHGDHTDIWLGEAASGARVPIRCGAHARIKDGKIVEGWLIIDIPNAFRAMGVDLFERARSMSMF